MEVRGPHDPRRAGLDRTSAGRDADRTGAPRRAGEDGAARTEFDRLDTGGTDTVRQAVDAARQGIDERAEQVRARRDELLRLADDPAAVRRAATGFLRSEQGASAV